MKVNVKPLIINIEINEVWHYEYQGTQSTFINYNF
jgi:hypothetical protein